MDNRELETLNLEDLDKVAGGRALPESVIKRFTRQAKEKGTPPEVVYHSFVDVSIDGYLGTEAMYKRDVKRIVEQIYGVQLQV